MIIIMLSVLLGISFKQARFILRYCIFSISVLPFHQTENSPQIFTLGFTLGFFSIICAS